MQNCIFKGKNKNSHFGSPLSSGELSGRLVWAAVASFKSGDEHVQPGQSLTASQGFCTTSANSARGQKPDRLVSMWRAVLRGVCGSMAGSLERTLQDM